MARNSVLYALADPMRQRILETLRGGGKPVGVIAAALPVSRPAVSQHLKVLKSARLVREIKRGTRRIYNIEPRGLVALRKYLDRLWSDALSAFHTEAGNVSGSAPRKRERGSE